MSLDWKRIPDGNYNGRPVYEYEAVDSGIRYHIYWAYNAGFGLSIAYYDNRSDNPPNASYGIVWARTLYRCKAIAEKYREDHFAEAA